MALSWPNRITILRMVLSPIFMLLVLNRTLPFQVAALAVFVISGLSDLYDGYIARRYGWVTNLGKFLDPVADKLLVSLALIGLVQIGLAPVWAAYMIIGRELLVTGLRAIAAYAGILIMPSRMGKWKATTQMLSIFFYLILSVSRTANIYPMAQVKLELIAFVLLVIAVALTLASGIDYFWRNRSTLARLLQ